MARPFPPASTNRFLGLRLLRDGWHAKMGSVLLFLVSTLTKKRKRGKPHHRHQGENQDQHENQNRADVADHDAEVAPDKPAEVTAGRNEGGGYKELIQGPKQTG